MTEIPLIKSSTKERAINEKELQWRVANNSNLFAKQRVPQVIGKMRLYRCDASSDRCYQRSFGMLASYEYWFAETK